MALREPAGGEQRPGPSEEELDPLLRRSGIGQEPERALEPSRRRFGGSGCFLAGGPGAPRSLRRRLGGRRARRAARGRWRVRRTLRAPPRIAHVRPAASRPAPTRTPPVARVGGGSGTAWGRRSRGRDPRSSRSSSAASAACFARPCCNGGLLRLERPPDDRGASHDEPGLFPQDRRAPPPARPRPRRAPRCPPAPQHLRRRANARAARGRTDCRRFRHRASSCADLAPARPRASAGLSSRRIKPTLRVARSSAAVWRSAHEMRPDCECDQHRRCRRPAEGARAEAPTSPSRPSAGRRGSARAAGVLPDARGAPLTALCPR